MKATEITKKISLMMDEAKLNEAKPVCKLKGRDGSDSSSLVNAAIACLKAAGRDSEADRLLTSYLKSDKDYTNISNVIP